MSAGRARVALDYPDPAETVIFMSGRRRRSNFCSMAFGNGRGRETGRTFAIEMKKALRYRCTYSSYLSTEI
jgi:hypothetical protein